MVLATAKETNQIMNNIIAILRSHIAHQMQRKNNRHTLPAS